MPNTEGFAKGSTLVNYPGVDAGIPLLSSFYFHFDKSGSSSPIDNHINQILVLPGGQSVDLSPGADLSAARSDNQLEVYYTDAAGNDRFDWFVRWATISPL